MLKTFDRSLWREDGEAIRERRTINPHTPPEMVRKHFPYKGVVTRACKIYGFKDGDVIPYVRTRHEPQHFPIEATTYGTPDGKDILRTLFLSSDEVQLIEA